MLILHQREEEPTQHQLQDRHVPHYVSDFPWESTFDSQAKPHFRELFLQSHFRMENGLVFLPQWCALPVCRLKSEEPKPSRFHALQSNVAEPKPFHPQKKFKLKQLKK